MPRGAGSSGRTARARRRRSDAARTCLRHQRRGGTAGAADAGVRRLSELLDWAAGQGGKLTLAIEGTGSYGAGLTSAVRRRDIGVIELMRTDRRDRRLRGKSDTVDAESAARAVLAGHASVVEAEGPSLVVTRRDADRLGLRYDFLAGWITLDVHSALAAVGPTAAVSAAMTSAGISCNVLAGYHHDHRLVPLDRVKQALTVLRDLAGPTG